MSTKQGSGAGRQALLSRRIRKALGKVHGSEGIPRRPPGSSIPLSVGQERLFFLQQRLPDSPFLNICRGVPLSGTLDLGALGRALARILQRHEALRTAFRQVQGSPCQIPRELPPEFPGERSRNGFPEGPALVDLAGLEAAARSQEQRRLKLQEAGRPMDLAGGRPFRSLLLRLADEEHDLILTFHHLIFDGWSLGIFSRELSRLYESFRRGSPPEHGPTPLQFGDFALWERHPEPGGHRPPEDLAYWQEHLEGIEPLELPADFPRKGGISPSAGVVGVQVPAPLRRELESQARESGGSLFAVLLASWGALLGRLSGRRDLVIGTAVANRPQRQLESVIGCFVNTLALRLQPSGDKSPAELTRRGAQVALEGMARQNVPFARVVQALQPERTQELAPLFRTTLALQNAPQETLRLAGLQARRMELIRASGTDQDLALSLEEDAGGLRGHILYSADLFCPTTVARWAGHWGRLLEGFARQRERPLDEISIWRPAERQQLLSEWPQPASRPQPLEFETLGDLFREQVRRWSARSAVVDATGESWTYRQLDAAALAIAHRLGREGVGPEDVVALCLDHSPELLAGILGTFKVGAAYLPLDPRNPKDRLRFMVEDAGARILLTAAQQIEDLPRLSIPTEEISMAPLVEAGRCLPDLPAPEPQGSSLAYVIYTSGSSGQPKGTLLSHGGVLRLVSWYCRRFGMVPQDRCALVAGPGFDVSVWEIWTALAAGGSLYVSPAGEISDLRKLLEGFRAQGITHAFLPTPLADALLEAVGDTGLESPLLQNLSLRRLVTAGDRLLRHPKEELPFPLDNFYGPTESTIYATWGPTRPGETGVPDIGRAVSGTEAWVLDRRLRPAPLGVYGELCLAGEGLARGYLGRPAQTAQSFVPHPLGDAPGARLYRTGDRVRWNSRGALEIAGRLDSQIKIRGFRVELGEITSLLCALPGVREGIVLYRENRLVAFLVREPGQAPVEGRLKEQLGERLPSHMVPDSFVELDRLPLSLNGKIDRQALARIDVAPKTPAESFVEPRDALEQVVAELFSEILGVSPVGAHDDFFALGGHSLLAGRLMTRLEAALGSQLPLDRLFLKPTVAGLAEELSLELSSAARPAAAIEALPRGGDFEVSFSQQRLWLVDRLESHPAAYGVPLELRLEGPLRVDRFQHAWSLLVERHEALRTIFPSLEDRPVQRILGGGSTSLPIVDLAGLGQRDREEEEARLVARAFASPMPLATGPLVRPLLLRLSSSGRRSPEAHTFFVALHHIIADAWSLGVLLRELSALYNRLAEGLPPQLPELRIQYADFAHWQRRWLEGEPERRQLAFWRSALADLPALEIPGDRPRPPIRDLRGGRFRQELSPKISEGIQALAKGHGLTSFMVLLAAFEIFLYRLTGEGRFAIGTPVAGRAHGDLESVIGFFVNTLCLRAEVRGGHSFEDYSAEVRQSTLDALAHQDLPFERLVEELAPRRSLSRTPLFQVMFLLHNAPVAPPELDGLKASLQSVETHISKFDLSLAAADPAGVSDTFVFQWAYQTVLLDSTTVQRWACHWGHLLEALLAQPGRPIDSLPLLSAPQRHQLLVEWTEPQPPYGVERLAHEQFLYQAQRAPEAVALRFEGRELSYGDLEEGSRHLAWELRARGVGPERRVALFLERGFEAVLSILAVLRAGGAYVPLDPATPTDRLRWLLEDSSAETVLVDLPSRGRWAAATEGWETAPRHMLVPAAESARKGSLPPALPPGPRLPQSAAYVIYTSGSTGRPKGVLVSQACLANRLRYAALRDIGPRDVFLHKTTLTFDVSILEILGPLVAGGRVVLARPGGQQDADYLLRLLAEEEITQASFPPTLLQVLLEREEFSHLPHLRTVITGGETVPVDLPERFFQRHRAQLLNRYGPTETSISVTSWPATPSWQGGSLPIGWPTAQARIYLLDPFLRPVPLGVTAELCIGGDGVVARGYLGRPRRSAGSFVPDPYSRQPGARLYRSGDLARQRSDGSIQFVGRGDRQVKIRGFRIELGEVEEALRRLPGIREAVVQDFGDGDGRWLGAYWIRENGSEAAETIQEEDLREGLAARLPDYMQPAGWRQVQAFPLTSSGKVDRKALPPIERVTLARFEAPRDEDEVRLAKLWEELLAVPRVGRCDDFFALGGHSLLATRLVSRIREAFNVQLPLRTLFEAPTVERLVQEIRQVRSPLPPAEEALPDSREEEEGLIPLSFPQERLWFVEHLQPGTPLYNIASRIDLNGELSLAALEASLEAVRARHDVLRTVFPIRNGKPATAQREGSLPLSCVDLSSLAPQDSETEADRLSWADSQRAFDLERGPLLRCLLLRLCFGEEAPRHRLMLTQHHIVSDAWSMGLLLGDLGVFYSAFVSGEDAPRLEEPRPYGEFARWQRQYLRGPAVEAKLERWKHYLTGAAPLLELPTDRPRPKIQGTEGDLVSFEVPRGVTGDLTELAAQERGTLFMITLAAFSVLLSRLSGQDEVVLGSPLAGRDRKEWEGIVGLFVNTLPLRISCGATLTFRQHLGQVREEVVKALEDPDLPFEFLVKKLAPERSLGHAPLFQASFALQAEAVTRLDMTGLETRQQNLSTRTAKLDLSLSLRAREAGLQGTLEFRKDLFDRTTIQRWMEYFRDLLATAAQDPEKPLARMLRLSSAARHQLALEWNDTEPWPLPSEAHPDDLPHLIARRAAERPEALALVTEEERWTYRQLDEQADRLAAFFRLQGVGVDSLVAVLLRRSPREVAVLLGILRAGGAYLPMDPSWPEQRRDFVLEDAQPALVVTEEALCDRLPSLAPDGPSVFDLDRDHPRVLEDRFLPPGKVPPPHALAYVIYTSGSTGRPKGVALHHGGLANLMSWHGREMKAGPEDRASRLAGQAFDASVWELWGFLAAGAEVHIPPPGTRSSPKALQAWLLRGGITQAFVPTPLAELLLELPWPPETPLRFLHTAGEALRSYRPEDLPFSLLNHYGPTEGTVEATYGTVPLAPATARPPSIGRPIGGVQTLVLGKDLQLYPISVAGELGIGGPGLARGYLRRPGLTASRFVPNPFGRRPGDRLYLTGDRVRQKADGELEFLGRLDHQIKIRGFRIELGEIEAALMDHPEILEAVVADFGEGLGRWLGAYWRREPGSSLSEEELRESLQDRLPEAMQPSGWLRLDEFPKTTSGKIDRKALPPIRKGRRAHFEAPRGEVEVRLAGIFEELLKVQDIGREGHFFDLGGHSLLATRLLSRIREAYRVELPLSSIFETPTVAALGHVLGEKAKEPVGPDTGLHPSGSWPRETAALSFAEERMWFVESLFPGTAQNNISASFAFQGPLEEAHLGQAIQTVWSRHDSLRTIYPTPRGKPIPEVLETPASLPLLDFSGLSRDLAAGQAQQLIQDEACRPFDLSQGPLCRFLLLRVSQSPPEHLFVLSQHHIVSDGWSFEVFLEELGASYEALGEGREGGLPPVRAQYRDFARWQRQVLRGQALAESLSFWHQHLDGAPPVLALPLDRPRPTVAGVRGGHESFHVPAETVEKLEALAQAHRTSLFTVCLATFGLWLARTASQRDLVLGTPVAGRSREEWEGSIGLFVNMLALRIRLSSPQTYREFLDQVREDLLEALDHSEVPFEALVEDLDPHRDLGHAPLFQVLFSLQAEATTRLRLPGLKIEQQALPTGTAKLDLHVSLRPLKGALRGTAEYRRDLFDGSTVGRWTRQYVQLLGSIAQAPDAGLHHFEILSPGDRQQVLREWGQGKASVHPDLCEGLGKRLGELFRSQAERAPSKPAITWKGRELTYGELLRGSSEIAHRLRVRGGAPEMPVAVSLPRSPLLIAALLGVLQAGRPYVPVDPSYPQERQRFMIEDSGADILLCSSPPQAALPPFCNPLPLDEGIWQAEPVAPATAGNGIGAGKALAYVIYTSGSTGRPKGVAICHDNALALLAWARSQFSDRELSGVLAGTSVSFDLSIFEIFLPLSFGGRVLLVDNALEISSLPGEAPVRLLNTVPSVLGELLRQSAVPDSVETINLAGEVLSRELAARIFGQTCARKLWNLYGPTEDTTYSTAAFLVKPPPGPVSIGRPIAGSRARVLGPNLELVGPGTSGELYLAGDGLARGYLGRPRQTAERFLPELGGREPGRRMYRTGDRVRWSRRGQLYFEGRWDHQVKVRGFRIELGEIEAHLEACPQVAEAVVSTVDQPTGSELVAYVVSSPGADPAAAPGELSSKLSEELRKRLPQALIPSLFESLGALPRTANGKVDRRALPVPGRVRETPAAILAPRTPEEAWLAKKWCEVLGLPEVGIRDDFFALGGHSLLAARLAAEVGEAQGRRWPLITFFEHRTVEAQAQILEASGLEIPPEPPPTLQLLSPGAPGSSSPPLFLIHPVSGTVLCYLDLVRALASDRAVYGFQARGLQTDEEPAEKDSEKSSEKSSEKAGGALKEIAESYLQDLRTLQPTGPYSLGGWSMGGVIAFEMGRQLVESGERVAPLLLIDAWPADPRSGNPDVGITRPEKDLQQDLLRSFLLHFGLRLPESLLPQEAIDPEVALAGPLKEIVQASAPHLGDFDLVRLFRVFRANVEAFEQYRAEPAPLDALLVKALAASRAFGDLADRWRVLLGELEVREVEADHFSILRGKTVAPFVPAIRRLLGEEVSLPESTAPPATDSERKV